LFIAPFQVTVSGIATPCFGVKSCLKNGLLSIFGKVVNAQQEIRKIYVSQQILKNLAH